MTLVDMVYQRRLAVVTYAVEIGDLAEAARTFGLSRMVHAWKNLFEAYGPDGLRLPTRLGSEAQSG